MSAKRKSKAASVEKPKKMRALSVRQPWAELILQGEKEAEYRSMATKIRGTVYLYASLGKYTRDLMDEFSEELGFDVYDLDRGVLIGTVEVYDCEEDDDGYAWLLRNPVRFKKPLAINQGVQPQPAWFYPFGKPE